MAQLYHTVYWMELPLLYLLAGLFLAGWTAVGFWGRRYPRCVRWSCRALLPVPLLLVYLATLWGRTAGEYTHYIYPLEVLFLEGFTEEFFRQFTLNTLLFIPFGAVMAYALPQRVSRRVAVTVALGLSVSLAVELTQLWGRWGHFQTDDLLYNMLGSFLGALPCWILASCQKKKSML